MQIFYSKLSGKYNALIKNITNTEKEIEVLNNLFKKNKINSILDVACGTGRHSIELAKLGYEVVGIDYSKYQIAVAQKNSKKISPKIKFLVRNANDFNFHKKFDAAICMWTTIGEEPIKYQKLIKNVYDSLKSEGIFVIDNKTWVDIPKSGRREYEVEKKIDGLKLSQKFKDQYTENFRIREIIYDINGKKFEDLSIAHLLKPEDLKEELKKIGFKKVNFYYNYKKKKDLKAKRVLIVAYK